VSLSGHRSARCEEIPERNYKRNRRRCYRNRNVTIDSQKDPGPRKSVVYGNLTREALFEALLRTNLDALTQRAGELEASTSPDEALLSWFREWVEFALSQRGVVAMMAAAHTNPDSALYASCAAAHSASGRLLLRAQAEGTAHTDMNGDDLFGLMSALGWLVDLPSFAPRADHLFHILASAILTNRPSNDAGEATC
jgi:hypothetical protein